MRTTKKHLQYFRERCEHWITVFGLQQWTVGYFHSNLPGIYAETFLKFPSHVVTITLSTNFTNAQKMIDYNIDDHLNRIAFHEVVHMLLEPLEDRSCSTDVLYSRNEAVAHSIEHAMLGRPRASKKK